MIRAIAASLFALATSSVSAAATEAPVDAAKKFIDAVANSDNAAAGAHLRPTVKMRLHSIFSDSKPLARADAAEMFALEFVDRLSFDRFECVATTSTQVECGLLYPSWDGDGNLVTDQYSRRPVIFDMIGAEISQITEGETKWVARAAEVEE